MRIRSYNPETDYDSVKVLYSDTKNFGGQFDVARDTSQRLQNLIKEDNRKILVAEQDGKIFGTVTLFEDGRSAWLYRFAVLENQDGIEKILFDQAIEYLKEMGHSQVLVYAPDGDQKLEKRYLDLGMSKGNSFTAFWCDI